MYRAQKELQSLLVNEKNTVREAIQKLDTAHHGIILIVNKNKSLKGIFTDGDFRRLVLNGISLDAIISDVMNTNPRTILVNNATEEALKKLFNTEGLLHLPIVDEYNKVVDVTFLSDFMPNIKKRKVRKVIDNKVVIMAGGKGTRLDPFTRILPKPLIPIGNKAIIEIIMDEYAKYGMKKFYISINHKGRMIQAYFEEQDYDYTIEYITENKPLGTAGALKLIEGKISSPFFVSNCDIVIKDDYTKIYDFHKNGNYVLTLVGSMQHHTIPYGVCEIENGGKLKSIKEKPGQDFLVNTGMYLLNPEVLQFIPNNKFYHITNLIDKLKNEGFKIGVYPVSEKSWIDIGELKGYKRNLDIINKEI